MLNPLDGRVKIEDAESALGIDDEGKELLKQVSLLRLIRLRLGITDAEIEAQYEADLKAQIIETSNSLSSLIHGGITGAA